MSPVRTGGETPPHTPPRRRSAPPDLCIESAPGGESPRGASTRHRATRRKSTPAPCILRMRGANPSGWARIASRFSPPFPVGRGIPPHAPPRRRSAPPDLCIESAPGGNLPEGQAPGIAPPGEKAHLLPAFFGCGALTAFGGTRVSAESGQFSRWGRGARLTRRVREEPPPGELARVYSDRNATMSGA